jgi:predicted ATPase/DNA-binding SARP family transcriptional activator
MLEIRLLGTFDIKEGKQIISISSRPAQSLFAYLVLNAGTFHRREKLAGMLWPDSLDETARDNLRHALWRIRKALPSRPKTEYLLTDEPSVAFNTAAEYWLDAAALEKLGEDCPADELMAAFSEYQGELLPGFYDEWVLLEREHLSSIFEHHMARLMALLQEQKRWLDILDWGERWIKLGQKPEPAYRALMSAHAAKGNMSKVAATYERCVKSLKEFGIGPSEQTRDIYENLKQGKELPKTAPAMPKISSKEVLSNIPVPLTSFVGREKEMKEIARLLTSSRLLTLTGPGGVGKTRLAIQTADDSIRKFKDGVYWASLVGLSDETLIPHEISHSLNVRETPNEPLIETLKTQLRSKDVLLVIDNCEHLIKACAQVVEQLLAACPRLKILATSIEALGLFNERVWQVPSLPLPEMQQSLSIQDIQEFASIELFQERGANARPGFKLDERNAAYVTQICRRLDGIPLAIELAAARIKVLTVEEIASRLDDRFSLLTAGSRTAIPRHQTLRSTIDWSYDLLTELERILFRRLSVFVNGFTLDAAEAVCSQEELKRREILDLLGHLVDKSLVIVETEAAMSGTRYRLLETIRQYAVEKLVDSGEALAIRDQHLEFYVELAEKSEENIFGSESAAWFARLDRELDNIRAAIDWSTGSGKAVAALQIAGSLVYFWFAHGHLASEWHDRIQQALLRPEGRERTLARAKALNGIGFMYWADIYPTDRRPELEEALSIAREYGDRWNIATAYRNLGLLENIKGNYSEARSLLEESLAIWRDMGSEGEMGGAWTLIFLGDAALNHDDREWAVSLYKESVEILKTVGDINFLAYSLRRLAQLAWCQGDHERAIPLCRESLTLNIQVNDPRGILACLAGFADIALAQGRLERAAVLMGAVDAQLSSADSQPTERTEERHQFVAGNAIGIRLLYIDKMEYERNLALIREQVDEQTLAKFWIRGQKLSFQEAITLTLEEI